MNIVVTGGAGFIGSHYVRSMLDGAYRGHEAARATVVDKLSYAGNRDSLPRTHPRLEFVQGDICDLPLLLDVLAGKDAVVHLAAESHVDRSISSADEFIRTNVGGTQTVLEACRRTGVERIVHVSTDEVYGSVEVGSSTEGSPLLPNSPYAASKAAADMVARSYWRTHGLNLSITRCSNNYGPYQHIEKLIPRFVTNLIEGLPVPLYGDGSHIREWLHVDDHCRAIQLVLTRGGAGEVYNVGGGDAHTNLAITQRLLEFSGAGPAMIHRMPDRLGHDLRYCLDDSKIRQQLGYAPAITLDDGLFETYTWYRDNPTWWKPLRHEIGSP